MDTSKMTTNENTAVDNKNNNLLNVKNNQPEPMDIADCMNESYKRMLDDDDEDAAFLDLNF